MSSDAYATGQPLHALRLAGISPGQFLSAAATSWAVMALAPAL
jgi:hypothetical protein